MEETKKAKLTAKNGRHVLQYKSGSKEKEIDLFAVNSIKTVRHRSTAEIVRNIILIIAPIIFIQAYGSPDGLYGTAILTIAGVVVIFGIAGTIGSLIGNKALVIKHKEGDILYDPPRKKQFKMMEQELCKVLDKVCKKPSGGIE